MPYGPGLYLKAKAEATCSLSSRTRPSPRGHITGTDAAYWNYELKSENSLMPNTHRRRDETVELRRVGVGGVYTVHKFATKTHDDCRRIRRCERSRRP